MPVIARTQPTYAAVETAQSARPRCPFARRALLLVGVTASAACLCALAGTRSRSLRAQVASAVILDVDGAVKLPPGKEAPLVNADVTTMDLPPKQPRAATEHPSGSTNETLAAVASELEDNATANSSTNGGETERSSREGSEPSVRGVPAVADVSSLCIEDDVAHVPLDMPGHDMSYESSVQACQMRCAAIEGCETFTFFRADKSCHVQDGSAARLHVFGALAGRPSCDAMTFKKL